MALALVPMLIAVTALGAHALPPGEVADHVSHTQILLILAGLVVSGVGGFLIWSAATALARGAEVELPCPVQDERPAEPLPDRVALSSSVTRMLRTIEQQSDEIKEFAGQLDTAHRELEAAKTRLQEASFVDPATGLYNDRFFVVRLEQEVARYERFGHPLSLVLVEIGDVGTTGDERGAPVDDEALRSVVDVLVKSSRGVDVICRYGDEELAVLLVETPGAQAGAYVRRIRDILSACLWGQGGHVAVSFGTASLPDDAGSGHDLVRVAAEALDAARRDAGGGQACGEPGVARPGMREVPAA